MYPSANLFRVSCVTIAVMIVAAGMAASGDKPAGEAPKSASAQTAHVAGPPKPIAPFVEKALRWLSEAQHPDGGWGAGSHANQNLRDPHKVVTDPATTAFAAMALLRAGSTPVTGDFREPLRRATEYLVRTVEGSPSDGPKITDVQGTQPQAKLGPYVDTSTTAHFLSRVLTTLPATHELKPRVDAALEKCLRKLERSQAADGSWAGGGWAPVLQSALGCSALELAQAAGKQVDKVALEKARDYQKGNVNGATGRARAEAGAGVELYAFAGAQRAAAGEARAADQLITQARSQGQLPADAEVNTGNLIKLGVASSQAADMASAFQQNEAQLRRLDDENLLAGFGNNGGEEYLSYLMTSESLVIAGGEEWDKWNSKMHERLSKIQSPDGSWTGHHCITSPVFCTAAVVQCLTTDRDAAILLKIASAAGAKSPVEKAGSAR